jgi:hypothetical protein
LQDRIVLLPLALHSTSPADERLIEGHSHRACPGIRLTIKQSRSLAAYADEEIGVGGLQKESLMMPFQGSTNKLVFKLPPKKA